MKYLIVDNRITHACELSLIKEGFSLLKLPKDPYLADAVASHPDTVLFYDRGEMITTADYCDAAAYVFTDIREAMPDIRISFTSDVRSNRYPYDCVMNALRVGNQLYCKTDTVSQAILDLAKTRGYEIIHTNQGYPACSVLTFGNSAIAADPGLAYCMANNGVRVTLIGNEGISLPPYEYGFIGGASGVVGRKVYFFGDIYTHPDCDKILHAIKEEGFIPCSLSNEELVDLGGIIPL